MHVYPNFKFKIFENLSVKAENYINLFLQLIDKAVRSERSGISGTGLVIVRAKSANRRFIITRAYIHAALRNAFPRAIISKDELL